MNRSPRTVGALVTLSILTNSSILSSGGPVFRITNGNERAILLTDLVVETNSPAGWQALSHTVPSHPQRLATGDTKDLAIASPCGAAAWRLRVTYGKDVKGLLLLLGKVDHAIFQHSWPGQSFGIMAGSNSCIGREMTK